MYYYFLLSINVLTFFTFGLDKLFAKIKHRRIPEKILILFSLIFGSFGAALGMLIFNHKTSKPKFRFLIPILTIIHASAIYIISKNIY